LLGAFHRGVEKEMEDYNKVVVFQIAQGEYSISIDYVISIEKEDGITEVPSLPNHIIGIKKVRNELIPIIDLEQVLYNRPIRERDQNKLIVLKTEELTYAVLVSDAKEILAVAEENIKQVGLAAYQKTSYFTGVINLDNRLIMMVDPFVLIDSLDGIKEIKEYMNTLK
jgi:purine-binding chemotaxis protein CheW